MPWNTTENACSICKVKAGDIRFGKRDQGWCRFHLGDAIKVHCNEDAFMMPYQGLEGIIYDKAHNSSGSNSIIVKAYFHSDDVLKRNDIHQLNNSWFTGEFFVYVRTCTDEELLTHHVQAIRDIALYHCI